MKQFQTVNNLTYLFLIALIPFGFYVRVSLAVEGFTLVALIVSLAVLIVSFGLINKTDKNNKRTMTPVFGMLTGMVALLISGSGIPEPEDDKAYQVTIMLTVLAYSNFIYLLGIKAGQGIESLKD